MKLPAAIKRSAWLVAIAVMSGTLLSGCANVRPDTSNGCVGPADFCHIYFGS